MVNDKVHNGYDIIINATYTDTNLGLPKEKRFELKYEVTALAIMDAPFGDDVALSILIIAHRTESLAYCSRVLVMEEGRLVGDRPVTA